MASVMEGNVFGVAERISHDRVLVRSPRDHPRAQGETVTADRSAGGRGIHPVRVRESKRFDCVCIAQREIEESTAFQLPNNVYRQIQV
jgi:hypothetical protein